ncbi:MAG: alkyl sulfatase dimerization domain-containing protein [Promethearchaeota archaeon]
MVRKTTEGMRDWVGLFGSSTFGNGSCHFIGGMANTCVFDTKEGLVIFDLPMKQFGSKTFKAIRERTDRPVRYFIYSHGHFDHAFAFEPFIKELKEKGWIKPDVIAHENCIKRFEKYRMLSNYHDWINKMQFASFGITKQKKLVSALETLDPTIILKGNDAKYNFELGKIQFELTHDKGETDDSIWLWVPEKDTICAGDLFVSSFPNVGNPFKVQRYPKDWAIAMDKMIERDAEFLAPGHGLLIKGKKKVKDALSITSEVMHFVHDEVVKRLNEGKWFEQTYYEMLEIFPEKFKNHPLLREMYGCYRFAIHASYRLYHGWYNSGNPTDLFPSKVMDIAKELLKLNSAEVYLNHAERLFGEGKLQLALHILDIIINGVKEEKSKTYLDALQLKYDILKRKVQEESSFIATNILDNGRYNIKEKIKMIQKQLK